MEKQDLLKAINLPFVKKNLTCIVAKLSKEDIV